MVHESAALSYVPYRGTALAGRRMNRKSLPTFDMMGLARAACARVVVPFWLKMVRLPRFARGLFLLRRQRDYLLPTGAWLPALVTLQALTVSKTVVRTSTPTGNKLAAAERVARSSSIFRGSRSTLNYTAINCAGFLLFWVRLPAPLTS